MESWKDSPELCEPTFVGDNFAVQDVIEATTTQYPEGCLNSCFCYEGDKVFISLVEADVHHQKPM